MSADCKGVRILKSERAEGALDTPACARRRRGEKPSLKKDAVVVTDFSFYPQARTAQEIVKGLLNQFTQKEKDQARKNRQKRTALGLCHPREPIHKHVFATMNGKKEAFEHLIRHVHKRDPTLEKPIIALIDGEPALERRLKECLEAYNMTDQLDAIILDIIHATGIPVGCRHLFVWRKKQKTHRLDARQIIRLDKQTRRVSHRRTPTDDDQE